MAGLPTPSPGSATDWDVTYLKFPVMVNIISVRYYRRHLVNELDSVFTVSSDSTVRTAPAITGSKFAILGYLTTLVQGNLHIVL